jgi:RNA recognition motif-containing protein
MGKKLYVGSLPWGAEDDDLREHFSSIGEVVSAKIITDRDTGRSKGFGFVEMATEEEARRAIDELNGSSLMDRSITVNEARPQQPRGRGGFGRKGGYGGGRGGYGGGRGGYGGGRDSGYRGKR